MPKLKLKSKHRILCEDSTKQSEVLVLMAGELADVVYTDPPFGINLDTDYSKMGDKAQTHRKIIGDDKPFDGLFLMELFSYCDEIFLFGANYYFETLNKKGTDGSWFVWDKYPTDQNDKRFGSAFELIWSKKKHKQKILRVMSLNVGHYKPEAIVHPTQKPTSLSCKFILDYSKENDLIVDLFLGSGSTLIACEKTNRKCFGMEIDPHYIDVIVKRYSDFTHQSDNIYLERDGEKIPYSTLVDLNPIL